MQGAKLSALKQATAYQRIRKAKAASDPPIAAEQTDQIRATIENYSGECETNETIWISLRKPVLRMQVQQFLYKTLHQAHMVGPVWGQIPEYVQQQFCTTCHKVDSMEHILTQCPANTNQGVWNLTKQTWPHPQELWPRISLSLILEITCINIPWQRAYPAQQINPQRPPIKQCGASRLLQILVLEATHLIRVMRCERVIQEKQHTEEEIKTRWLCAINNRLTCDRIIAIKIKRDDKNTKLIKHTWGLILQKQHNTPNDWLCRCEVLVGSG